MPSSKTDSSKTMPSSKKIKRKRSSEQPFTRVTSQGSFARPSLDLDIDAPKYHCANSTTERLNQTLENRHNISVGVLETRRRKVLRTLNHDTHEEVERLRKIVSVAPVSNYEVFELHRRRRQDMRDFCIHLTSCYLKQQEANKVRWEDQVREGSLSERPVKTPEHEEFVQNTFPSTFARISDADVDNYRYHPEMDIYRSMRAWQTPECLNSYRKRLSETFRAQTPINVAAWLPPIELYMRSNKPPSDKSSIQSTLKSLNNK